MLPVPLLQPSTGIIRCEITTNIKHVFLAHFDTKSSKIADDFVEQIYNNDKPWKIVEDFASEAQKKTLEIFECAFFICSCFVIFSFFHFFRCFTIFPFCVFFSVILLLFLDAENGKKRREVPTVKISTFLCEDSIVGPRWPEGQE